MPDGFPIFDKCFFCKKDKCIDCLNIHIEKKFKIKKYIWGSKTPVPMIYPAPEMGIEIEVDFNKYIDRQKCCEKLCQDKKFNQLWIVKKEIGLESGLEFVSYPLKKDTLLLAVDYLLNIIREFNPITHDNTGIHIHVNRKLLEEHNWMWIRKFVNMNKEWFIRHSERESNFAQYVDNNITRDRAVNLNPEHTVEFRMFRCKLERNYIRKIIIMVWTLCKIVPDDMQDFRYVLKKNLIAKL